jgi:hypothetical protein
VQAVPDRLCCFRQTMEMSVRGGFPFASRRTARQRVTRRVTSRGQEKKNKPSPFPRRCGCGSKLFCNSGAGVRVCCAVAFWLSVGFTRAVVSSPRQDSSGVNTQRAVSKRSVWQQTRQKVNDDGRVPGVEAGSGRRVDDSGRRCLFGWQYGARRATSERRRV